MLTRKQLHAQAKQTQDASGICVELSKMKKADLQKYINKFSKTKKPVKTIKIKIKKEPKPIKIKIKKEPKTIKIKIKKPVKPIKKKVVVKPVVKKLQPLVANLTTQGDFLKLYKKLTLIFNPIANDKFTKGELMKAIKFFIKMQKKIKTSKKIIYAKYVGTNNISMPTQITKFSWYSEDNLMSYLKANNKTKKEFVAYLIDVKKAIKILIDDGNENFKIIGKNECRSTILDEKNFDKAEEMYNLLNSFIKIHK